MTASNPQLLDDGQQTDYAGQLEALTDADLVQEAATQIRIAGYSRRVTVADQKAGICYTEATARREKPWLYAQAYNSAADACGVEIDAADRARARPPLAA